VTMFDAKTLATIKTIDVGGRPDGLMYDAFNDRVYVLSHSTPNATVINAADGSIAGTIDLGGAPEQAAADGKGRVYVAIEDKDNIAVIDAKTLKVTAHYDIAGKAGTCAGLALDAKNQILFAACRAPQTMVILSAKNGKVITTLPIGRGTDGAGFNPGTMEAFSSQGDGTLTIIKEGGPARFSVEQTVPTMAGAKSMTLDAGTNRVMLITAEYGPAPVPKTAPENGRIARGPMVRDSFSIIVVGK
jgi:DNA-binding beta-propeller fold protein YncE